MLTGLNEAFVVDHGQAARLGNDKGSRPFVHPFLGGEDIRTYHITRSDKWMIVIPHGWTHASSRYATNDPQNAYKHFAQTLPAIAAHLKPFQSSLEARQDQGEFWWELRPCDYYTYFERPKIIFPDICKNPRFFYDDTGLYLTNTAYCLGTGDKRLLAFLNSHLFWFLIAGISIPFGMRSGKYRYRLIYQYMEHVPIHLNGEHLEIESRLDALADVMLT